jgi:molybdenum cofactor biosynthesis enzyme MoaA
MGKLNSLSLFAGTGECNASCNHCAGVPIRKYAPKEDGIVDKDLIEKTVRDCYGLGARYLSISSSGEPTLSPSSVTKVFNLLQGLESEGIKFSPINMYTNGIRIGEDENFSNHYLPLWKSQGLTRVYVTVHDIDEEKNAKAYGVSSYPSLQKVFSRIHDADLLVRSNLVLRKETISTFEEFSSTVNYLLGLGVDSISSWPIRGLDDFVDLELSPPESELGKMGDWIKSNADLEKKVRLLREDSKADYTEGRKLTLFPDGTLSNMWCN